jgi:hypothetical protein
MLSSTPGVQLFSAYARLPLIRAIERIQIVINPPQKIQLVKLFFTLVDSVGSKARCGLK